MAIEILRDLRGLRVEVMHPPDADGVSLIEHLQRIGCVPTCVWPIPSVAAPAPDLIVLAVDHDTRDPLKQLCRSSQAAPPTVIAVVGYENPSTLQLVLEIGAHAVIERPIHPFGLLTQLVVARSLWLQQQENSAKTQKLERKLAGLQRLHRARLILMTNQKLSEDEAYKTIRRHAMTNRVALEDAATAIIHAHERMRQLARD